MKDRFISVCNEASHTDRQFWLIFAEDTGIGRFICREIVMRRKQSGEDVDILRFADWPPAHGWPVELNSCWCDQGQVVAVFEYGGTAPIISPQAGQLPPSVTVVMLIEGHPGRAADEWQKAGARVVRLKNLWPQEAVAFIERKLAESGLRLSPGGRRMWLEALSFREQVLLDQVLADLEKILLLVPEGNKTVDDDLIRRSLPDMNEVSWLVFVSAIARGNSVKLSAMLDIMERTVPLPALLPAVITCLDRLLRVTMMRESGKQRAEVEAYLRGGTWPVSYTHL
ncbi:MAG: hypothetical protein N3A57_02630, partial [Negativicutes bacterium]|nr:hypothetical protein [Negativicutes bacterium]